MKAVIYLRVSTKEQAEEGYSIPAQAEACRRFVADQGWDLADEYVDRGESARTADRPQLQAMLARLAEGRSIDCLVVHKLDRLARNLEDHAAVRAALRKAHVQLHSVTESLEDSASGKLVEGILASIAEFYSANLGQEIRKGMDQKAAQGGWPVRAPFGYRNVRRDGGRRGGASVLEPDRQAPIVVWAFERYATGSLSVAALTGALAEKGLRNRLGNPPGNSAVHRMLRSPVYAGVVRWKGAEREGIHKPLVSRNLFDRVQSVLDAHSTGGDRGWKHDHYLKGTLVCAECGSKLYYALAKRRFGYFRCIGRNTRRTRCSQGRYVPSAELEREVEALYEGVQVPAALRRRLERVLGVEVAERERHRAEVAEFLSRRLRQLANEREKLLRAYYADAIDVAILKREQARINAEVSDAESQLATDGEKLAQAKQIIDLALDLAKDCTASYRKARPEVRKMWNRAFFDTIGVRDGAVADFTYEEPFASLLGSHKGSMVVPTRIRTRVSTLRGRTGLIPRPAAERERPTDLRIQFLVDSDPYSSILDVMRGRYGIIGRGRGYNHPSVGLRTKRSDHFGEAPHDEMHGVVKGDQWRVLDRLPPQLDRKCPVPLAALGSFPNERGAVDTGRRASRREPLPRASGPALACRVRLHRRPRRARFVHAWASTAQAPVRGDEVDEKGGPLDDVRAAFEEGEGLLVPRLLA